MFTYSKLNQGCDCLFTCNLNIYLDFNETRNSLNYTNSLIIISLIKFNLRDLKIHKHFYNLILRNLYMHTFLIFLHPMNKAIFDRVQKSYFHRNLISAIFHMQFIEHKNRDLYLGILHYESLDYVRALFHLKRHLSNTSKYYQALCYRAIKEFQKAVDSLVHILENKDSVDLLSDTFFDLFILSDYEYVHEVLGECLTNINEREQGLNAYASACQIYPLYSSVTNLLMEEKNFKVKRANKLEAEFYNDLDIFYKTRDENLIEKYRMNIPGVGSYFVGECAKVYVEDGDFERSHVLFETMRKLDPFNFSYCHFYSTLLWYKKDAEKLAQMCRTLIEYIPGSFILWIALGNYFSLKFDHTRSITCFKRSIHINTNHYSLLLLGHEYILKQEYTLAQKCFTHSLKHLKNNYNAFFSIGIIHANSGKNENAEHYFLKGIKINNKNNKLKVLLMEFYNRNQMTHKILPLFLEIFNMVKLDVNGVIKCIKNKVLDLNEELAVLELIDHLVSEGHQDKCEEIIEVVKHKGRVYQKKRELLYGKIN